MNVYFEALNKDNCKEAVDIYSYYVTETTVSYATEPIEAEEFISYYKVDCDLTLAYRIMVDDTTAGFCLLKPWNASKQAYEQTYEFTIYISKEYCHKGIGKIAFNYLEEKAKARGIAVIMAGMSYDNVSSYKLCESVGFERCGHFKKVGKKFGEYLDLYYYQKLYI